MTRTARFDERILSLNTMKPKPALSAAIMIFGIVVTLFLLMVTGLHVLGKMPDRGFITVLKDIGMQCITWKYPSTFFVIYFIGYVLVWWKHLWGAVIIIAASLLFFLTNTTLWNLALTLPALLVGVFYILLWNMNRRKASGAGKIEWHNLS